MVLSIFRLFYVQTRGESWTAESVWMELLWRLPNQVISHCHLCSQLLEAVLVSNVPFLVRFSHFSEMDQRA